MYKDDFISGMGADRAAFIEETVDLIWKLFTDNLHWLDEVNTVLKLPRGKA